MSETHEHNAGQKEPDTKEFVLCDSMSAKYENRHSPSVLLEVRIVFTLGQEDSA